jgi:hypothetical protein
LKLRNFHALHWVREQHRWCVVEERREPVTILGGRAMGDRGLPWRLAAALAVAGAAAGLCGCSSALDSPYPAVHDMPAPRPEPPMSPEELKRATDVLLSDRERLSAEAQGANATGSGPGAPQPSATSPARNQRTGGGARP